VALRYYAAMTEQEVATAMGVATGTVSATLSLARPRLESGLLEQSTEELAHG